MAVDNEDTFVSHVIAEVARVQGVAINPNDPLVKWHLDRLESGATGTIIGAA